MLDEARSGLIHEARLVAVAMIPVAMIPVAAASVIGQFATHRNLTLMRESGQPCQMHHCPRGFG
jgi:hypothetical protein